MSPAVKNYIRHKTFPDLQLFAEKTSQGPGAALGLYDLGKILGNKSQVLFSLPDAIRLTHEVENAFFHVMKTMPRLILVFGAQIFTVGLVSVFMNMQIG